MVLVQDNKRVRQRLSLGLGFCSGPGGKEVVRDGNSSSDIRSRKKRRRREKRRGKSHDRGPTNLICVVYSKRYSFSNDAGEARQPKSFATATPLNALSESQQKNRCRSALSHPPFHTPCPGRNGGGKLVTVTGVVMKGLDCLAWIAIAGMLESRPWFPEKSSAFHFHLGRAPRLDSVSAKPDATLSRKKRSPLSETRPRFRDTATYLSFTEAKRTF